MSKVDEEVIRACGRVERIEEHFGSAYGLQIGTDVAEKVLAEAADPKHGSERLVRLGDVLDWLWARAHEMREKGDSEYASTITDATAYLLWEFAGTNPDFGHGNPDIKIQKHEAAIRARVVKEIVEALRTRPSTPGFPLEGPRAADFIESMFTTGGKDGLG